MVPYGWLPIRANGKLVFVLVHDLCRGPASNVVVKSLAVFRMIGSLDRGALRFADSKLKAQWRHTHSNTRIGYMYTHTTKNIRSILRWPLTEHYWVERRHNLKASHGITVKHIASHRTDTSQIYTNISHYRIVGDS